MVQSSIDPRSKPAILRPLQGQKKSHFLARALWKNRVRCLAAISSLSRMTQHLEDHTEIEAGRRPENRLRQIRHPLVRSTSRRPLPGRVPTLSAQSMRCNALPDGGLSCGMSLSASL